MRRAERCLHKIEKKGLIPGESRIRRFQNIEKIGSDLIQDQYMGSALSTAAVQSFPTVSQRGAGAWMTLESINCVQENDG